MTMMSSKLSDHDIRVGDVVWYHGSIEEKHDIYVVHHIENDIYYPNHPDAEVSSQGSRDGKIYILFNKTGQYLQRVRRQSFTYLEWSVS